MFVFGQTIEELEAEIEVYRAERYEIEAAREEEKAARDATEAEKGGIVSRIVQGVVSGETSIETAAFLLNVSVDEMVARCNELETRLREAEAACERAKAKHNEAKARLDAARARLETARAWRNELEISRDKIEAAVRAEKCEIARRLAPIVASGVIPIETAAHVLDYPVEKARVLMGLQ